MKHKKNNRKCQLSGIAGNKHEFTVVEKPAVKFTPIAAPGQKHHAKSAGQTFRICDVCVAQDKLKKAGVAKIVQLSPRLQAIKDAEEKREKTGVK